MDQKKILKIASIGIGIFISVLLLIMGYKVFSGVFTRAADFEPRDVVVSNISQNSVKVSWTSGEETQGVIEYGTTPTTLNFFAPEPQKTKTHTQDLTLLSPTTTYYFQVRVGDKKYDNGGVPWTFTTKGNEKSQATPLPTQEIIPTSVVERPTPVQRLEIPVPTSAAVCDGTDCAAIKAMWGKGCDSQDYIKCVRKASPTPGSTTATPTP